MVWLIVVWTFSKSYSQDIISTIGACNQCGQSITESGANAVWQNPAALSFVKSLTVGVSKELRSDIPWFNQSSFALAIPIRKSAFGFGVTTTGNPTFSTSVLVLASGMKLGITSLGFRLGYFQHGTNQFGRWHTWLIDFGGVTEFSERFLVAAVVSNVNQPSFYRDTFSPVPIHYQVGSTYKLDKRTNLITQFKLYQTVTFQTGIHHKILHNLGLHTQVQWNPLILYSGFSFKHKKIGSGFCLGLPERLPPTFQLSLQYP